MAFPSYKRSLDSFNPEASSPRPPHRRKLNNSRSTPTSTIANLGLVPDFNPTQARQQKPHSCLKHHTGPDLISPLSDELLLRILSSLSLNQLLGVSPVSRRFYTLACDSQLWKKLYYHRFVLPRARLIPGFGPHLGGNHSKNTFGRACRWGTGHRACGNDLDTDLKVNNAGDLNTGSSSQDEDAEDKEEEGVRDWLEGGITPPEDHDGDVQSDGVQEDPLLYYAPDEDRPNRTMDWKRQYRIRHNWAKGKCKAVELRLSGRQETVNTPPHEERFNEHQRSKKGQRSFIKAVQGIAVSADSRYLRAWDLRSRKLLGHVRLVEVPEVDGDAHSTAPSCMAIDEVKLVDGLLDIALGFTDGSFGVWRLSVKDGRLKRRYRHEKSSNGELIEMAYSHPYLITATGAVLVSLYTFGGSTAGPCDKTMVLPPPSLLTSLDSHTCQAPLSFSIRKTNSSVIASIAYTVTTHIGWSFGVQDLHISPPIQDDPASMPEITTTPIAHTLPLLLFRRPVNWIEYIPRPGHGSREPAESSVYEPPFTPPMTPRSRVMDPGRLSPHFSFSPRECGPKALCYNHPYLVATLPDNTLSHFLCRSGPSSLTVTSGHRLWGHTSGISQGQVNCRGKAVSVGSRGEEMRVWALEGATSRASNVMSVEIRPERVPGRDNGTSRYYDPIDVAEERDLVGFDDEMIVVWKQNRGGGESLVIYDFT